MKIKISTFDTTHQRDLYSGNPNPLNFVTGLQSEQYWDDSKSIEQLCDEHGYTGELKEKIMDLYVSMM